MKIDRQPITGGLVISKADAAERQLCTAIWLWFHRFDPVPIHGLACASWKILWKLHQKHGTGHRTIRESVIALVKPEYRADFITLINETENFIKHADKDPFSFHAFKPEDTESILIDCVLALRALNGKFPMECNVFQSWFLINRPEMMTTQPEHAHVVESARSYGANLDKVEFFRLASESIVRSLNALPTQSQRTTF